MISCVAESLKLLQIVAKHQNTGLSELSRLSGLNKSRTFRILSTLSAQHFVVQNEQGGYQLGHQLLVLGQYARNQLGLIQATEKVSKSLSMRFNENLQLRILEDLEVVQIWRKSSSQSLQVRSNVGNRRPLGAGAAGKVLLAFSPETLWIGVGEKLSNVEAEQLYQELNKTLSQGFYLSEGELTMGVIAIAVPVFNAAHQCIASFSMSIPQLRAEPERLTEITAAMLQAARTISISLGFNA